MAQPWIARRKLVKRARAAGAALCAWTGTRSRGRPVVVPEICIGCALRTRRAAAAKGERKRVMAMILMAMAWAKAGKSAFCL